MDAPLLVFDGRVGAAGDMLVGALLDAGADRTALRPIETSLAVSYGQEQVDKHGLAATNVTVQFDEQTPAEGHGHHRHYQEVLAIIDEIDVPPTVRESATAIVTRLARAEATVHGTTHEEVAFHEVGADDAIADIVGTAALIEDLDPDRILTTPLAVGGGEIDMHHGTYPAPGPAVTALLEDTGLELRGGPVDQELLTPTGAAILAEYATSTTQLPAMTVDTTGYGAGSMSLSNRPNVLRAVLGTPRGRLQRADIRILETNVDDISPEVIGDLQASLRDVGAKDITVVPATMKKARPGHVLKVVVPPERAEQVARRLIEETGTLGVRDSGVTHRFVADRAYDTVSIEVNGTEHMITVKYGLDTDGTILDVSAEYDDAAAVARETGQPLRDVLRWAEQAAGEQTSKHEQS